MRNLKRALSLALALVMVLSMMVVGAGAVSVDDFTDADEIVNKEAVTVLATLGVITGNDDGSYAPTDTISRAEMSTIICRVLNGGKDPVLGESVTNTYTDTASHWAKNYIEYCTTLGIIAGKGDGTFDPEGDVTVAEAAKMVLVALGYNAAMEGYTGANWQINVDARANPIGLYEDLSYTTTNAPLTRDNAAQMLYNALDCDMVRYDVVLDTTSSTVISTTQLTVTDETLLEDKFDAVKVEGVVIANEIANLETSGHLNDERTRILVTNFDDQNTYGNSDGTRAVDFAITTGLNELGRSVSIYVKRDTTSTNAQVLGSVIVSEDNVVVTDYTDDSIADVADDNNLDVDAAQVAVNYGNVVDYEDYDHAEDEVQGVEKILIDNDDDTDVDYVLMNSYHFGKVTSYVSSGDGSISIDLGRGDAPSMTADEADDVIGFEDVARDDYVIAIEIGGRIHVNVAETMVGTLEAYKEDGGIVTLTVDGTDYSATFVQGYDGGSDDIKDANTYGETYLNNEATFYLTVGGYVAAVGETDESAYRYALVLASGNTGLEDRVRVALSDGTIGTYDISSNSDYDADGAGTDDAQVGTVYRYSINGSGQIRLSAAYHPVNHTSENASFTQGRTAVRGDDMTTFYATGSTAFFYVGIDESVWNEATDKDGTADSIDADDVDVYTGYNSAPDLETGLNINAVVYTRDDAADSTNAGAVVFYGDTSLVTADVDRSLYISSVGTRNDDYINATAFIAGEPEAQSIQIDGSESVSVRTAYTYVINADGYYELSAIDDYDSVTNEGNSLGGNTDADRITVTRDSSNTFVAGGEEFVITDETLLVDHSKYLSSATGELGAGPYQGDELQWVVFNDDKEAILVVVRNDEVNSNVDHGDEDGDYNLDWDISASGRLSLTISNYVREDYMADDTAVKLDFDVYANGSYIESDTATIPANRDSVTLRTREDVYLEGDDITIEITNVEPAAVKVIYTDGEKDISDQLTGEPATVSTSTATDLVFTVDTKDSVGTVDITVSGAAAGNETYSGVPGTNTMTLSGVQGAYDSAVTVTITGLDDLNQSLVTVTGFDATALSAWGISGADATGVTLAVNVTTAGAVEAGQQVTGTIDLAGTVSADGVYGYRVVCEKLGVDAVLTSGGSETWNIRPTENMTITANDITVTPYDELEVTDYSWTYGEIEIVFNHDIATSNGSMDVSYTGTPEFLITTTNVNVGNFKVSVVNNVATITADVGDFGQVAGETVTISTDVVDRSETGNVNTSTTALALDSAHFQAP